MKKITTLLLAAIMVLSCLTGCGDSGTTPPSSDTPPAATDTKWPEKDITIDVCYTAGGTSDTAARQLAALMGEHMGVNINVVNVTGGSGSIAGLQVASAKHDGYTWLGDVAHTVSGWRVLDYADMGWEDFYGFYAATAPYVLFVAGDAPYATYQELFEAMKADPTMKWGNAGLGSINQLTGQLMVDTVGLEGNSVPYDGGRDAAIKVIAHEVIWSWCGISDVMDLAQSGDIKILGVCNSDPLQVESAKGAYEAPSMLKDYPDLATLEGLLNWGFRVSRDTPPEVIAKIEEAFTYAVGTDEWAAYCESNCLTPAAATGEDSDKMCARLEAIYAWGLFDLKLAAEGISPETFEIPRIENFKFPTNSRTAAAAPWPQ